MPENFLTLLGGEAQKRKARELLGSKKKGLTRVANPLIPLW
jgi:hypothetical protein